LRNRAKWRREPAPGRGARRVAPRLRWRGSEEVKSSEPAAPKEHAMMFAFAIALVGIVVLRTLDHLAAAAR
jgi:hypothetical protein